MISHISYINCFIWYSFGGSVVIMMQWKHIHIAVSKAQKVTFQHCKIDVAFDFIFRLHWYFPCEYVAKQAWCHRYTSAHMLFANIILACKYAEAYTSAHKLFANIICTCKYAEAHNSACIYLQDCLCWSFKHNLFNAGLVLF